MSPGPGPGERGAAPLRSALYVGDVRHRRRRPTRNAFRYRVYHVLIDVDELPRLDREIGGFGYRRAALTSFHDRDHFGPADVPVRTKLARWLADRGTALPAGRLEVVTNLRVVGHVFNPVSWWFAHHPDGRLGLVVAEVNNTFGDAHAYVLDAVEADADGLVRADADKVFHVSPFLDIADHRYGFVLRPPTTARRSRFLAHMDVADADGKLFDATQDERRVALTTGNLRRALRRHPLVTLHTVVRIHAQALRLWRRRTPFFRRPTPPDDGFHDLARPRTADLAPAPAPTARADVRPPAVAIAASAPVIPPPAPAIPPSASAIPPPGDAEPVPPPMRSSP